MTVLVARESFVAPGHRAVPKGTLVDASDPMVKDNPQLFESTEAAAGIEPAVKTRAKKEAE